MDDQSTMPVADEVVATEAAEVTEETAAPAEVVAEESSTEEAA